MRLTNLLIATPLSQERGDKQAGRKPRRKRESFPEPPKTMFRVTDRPNIFVDEIAEQTSKRFVHNVEAAVEPNGDSMTLVQECCLGDGRPTLGSEVPHSGNGSICAVERAQ